MGSPLFCRGWLPSTRGMPAVQENRPIPAAGLRTLQKGNSKGAYAQAAKALRFRRVYLFSATFYALRRVAAPFFLVLSVSRPFLLYSYRRLLSAFARAQPAFLPRSCAFAALKKRKRGQKATYAHMSTFFYEVFASSRADISVRCESAAR